MPTPAQILDGLAALTNDWRIVAVLWHGYFAIVATGLAIGARPPRKAMGVALALPLLSVSLLAWDVSNPFNGLAFTVLGLAMIGLSMRLKGHIRVARNWRTPVGIVIFACGWIYPHFLVTDSYSTYLYAAPTGVVPCPTLSIVIGVGLIVNALDSRAWSLLLAIAGLFYGIFGVFVLDVQIDWILIIAALVIFGAGVRSQSSTPASTFDE